jgi:bacillolysin
MRNKVLLIILCAILLAVLWLQFRTPSSMKPVAQKPAGLAPSKFSGIKPYSLATAPSVMTPIAWTPNTNANSQSYSLGRLMKQSAAATQTQRPSGLVLPPPQEIALQELLRQRGDGTQVYLRPGRVTPMQIKGDLFGKVDAPGLSAEEAARRTAAGFLHSNRDLLLIEDVDLELKLAKQQVGPDGRTNLRYTQFYRGLEVWPCELAVHLNPEGDVDLFDGVYVPTPKGFDTAPSISSDQAAAKARSMVPGGMHGELSDPQLLVYAPIDGKNHLGWKFKLNIGLLHDWAIIIDAKDGKPLYQLNACVCTSTSGSGLDELEQTRTLNISVTNGTYYLIDKSKHMFNPATGSGVIEIHDAKGTSISTLGSDDVDYIASGSPTAWSRADGVGASHSFSEAYDYFFERHNRSSFDGNGGSFYAIVNISNHTNANWVPEYSMMIFGNVDKYSSALDVVGHEFAHGVTFSAVSNGGLQYTNQSGALNESFSDIFGSMIEARTHGSTDWVIGGTLSKPLRSMSDPSSFAIGTSGYNYPSRMSEYFNTTSDNGGVHLNSSIINYAYYLLAEGLQGAVGISNAEKIFYKCLTEHMKPQSQFIDARLGCIAAAENLFGTGSPQALKTAEAFDAVEIFANPVSAPKPTITRVPISSGDAAMFIYYNPSSSNFDLARQEIALGDPVGGVAKLLNVKKSRLSVSGNGAFVSFVGNDNSFGLMNTQTGAFDTDSPGLVHSATISQDGRYGAFVLNSANGFPTNQIHFIDFQNSLSGVINLVTPIMEGQSISNIINANSMDFSSDGHYLIYDAVSSHKRPDGNIRLAWSLFAIDLSTGTQLTLVPPLEGLNIGNPSFSNSGDRFITFEAQDSNGDSGILVVDIHEGAAGLVGGTTGRVGHPCFNGDDSVIVYADYDAFGMPGRYTSLYGQALSASKLTPSGGRSLVLRYGEIGSLYRRGTLAAFNSPPTVSISSPSVNAQLFSPAIFNVTISAADPDGNGIAKVELYEGSTLLGADTVFPYGFSFNGLPSGNYRFYARAYDALGASTVSTVTPVQVSLSSGNGKVIAGGTLPRFEMKLDVPESGTFRVEVSTNLVNWISLGTLQTIEGQINFSDLGATNSPRRFYRAVKLP